MIGTYGVILCCYIIIIIIINLSNFFWFNNNIGSFGGGSNLYSYINCTVFCLYFRWFQGNTTSLVYKLV